MPRLLGLAALFRAKHQVILVKLPVAIAEDQNTE